MKYYYISVRTHSTLKVPEKTFLGSTVRGALCNLLEKKDADLYRVFHDSESEYPKYRFDISSKHRNFDFGLYLFMEDDSSIRKIIQYLKQTLDCQGLTTKNYKFPNSTISLNGEKIVFDEQGQPILSYVKPYILDIKLKPYNKNIAINIPHPCFITDSNGREAYKEFIEIKHLLLSIAKRKHYYETGEMVHYIEELKEVFEGMDKGKTKYKLMNYTFVYKRIMREQESKPIIGISCSYKVYNVMPETLRILQEGEVLGVGKKTADGAGKIEIKVLTK